MGESHTNTRELLRHIPRPLAERVEPELAAAAVKLYETRTKPHRILQSAWYHVEYGLNEQIDKSLIHDEYFGLSQQLLADLLPRSDANQDTLLGALTLSTYMPAFRKRAEGEPIESEDCLAIYRSLGAVLEHLKPVDSGQPPQWRMTEVSVLALSARTGQPWLLLYPTSPREETSSEAQFNHDSYFYDQNDKVRLQQKLIRTTKKYDDSITILTLEPLIDKALKATGGGESFDLADKVNYLLGTIIAESHDEKLTRDEINFLNFMSEAVAAHHSRLSSRLPAGELVA